MNDLTQVIPQLLAQGLLALRENCVMPRLVNSDYDTMAAEKGASITVPIPSAIAAKDVVPANVPPVTDDIHPTSAVIPLDQWKEAPFYLSDKDIMECMRGTIPMQASEAIKALANVVDSYLIGLYKGIWGVAGTAGTTPFASNTKDATDVRKVLNKQLAPLPDRRMVLDPDAEANALNLRAFQDTAWANSASVIESGVLATKLGFVWHMDQNIGSHTAGSLTGDPTVTGVNVIGTKTINLTCDADDVVALLKGDIVTFAGDTQTYVVTENLNIANSATGDLKINPGLKVATAGSEAISVKADHIVNLGFHRDCFAFASRPLADNVQGLGNLIQSAVDPLSGIALRLEISREHKRTKFSYDILYGASAVRPDLGVRLMG